MIEQFWMKIGKDGKLETKQSNGVGFHSDGPNAWFVPFVGLKLRVPNDLDRDGFIIPDAILTENPLLTYRLEPRYQFTNERATTLFSFTVPKRWRVELDESSLDIDSMIRINHHRQGNPEEFGFCLERKESSKMKCIIFIVYKKNKKWCTLVCPIVGNDVQAPMFEKDYDLEYGSGFLC